MNSTRTLWICQVGARDDLTFSEVSKYFWGEKSLHIKQCDIAYEIPTDNILYIKVSADCMADNDNGSCCPSPN